MPILHLMLLGLIISAYAILMIVLLSVSFYASAGKKEEVPATIVTPARRAGDAAVANETVAQTPNDMRRFG